MDGWMDRQMGGCMYACTDGRIVGTGFTDFGSEEEGQMPRSGKLQPSQVHTYCIIFFILVNQNHTSRFFPVKCCKGLLPKGCPSPAPPAPQGVREAFVTLNSYRHPVDTYRDSGLTSLKQDELYTVTLRQQRQCPLRAPFGPDPPGPTLPCCPKRQTHHASCRFSSNSIGDGGAKALAEALKVNQGLESLE